MTPVTEPPADCPQCARLVAFRSANQAKFPHFHNAPVPSFGPLDADLLIVGLAPGLKGANATGRPFTGDYAGDLLYATLRKFSRATGIYARTPQDGMRLVNTRIVNAVRCVPPENKPTGEEENNCRPYLAAELAAMGSLKAILALGQVAHKSVLKTYGLKQSAFKFAHCVCHDLGKGLPGLVDSYHCSRYNTQTGRLTEAMFHDVFEMIGRL